MKLYTLTVRNRALGLALGFVILAAAMALLLVGIALLAGIAVVGGLLGMGIMLWRRLRGRDVLGSIDGPARATLDPALEVFPDRPVLGPENAAPGA